MVAVVDLSDGELRAELSALGVSVGPIGPSTRSVYEKKLQKLRKEETAVKAPISSSPKAPTAKKGRANTPSRSPGRRGRPSAAAAAAAASLGDSDTEGDADVIPPSPPRTRNPPSSSPLFETIKKKPVSAAAAQPKPVQPPPPKPVAAQRVVPGLANLGTMGVAVLPPAMGKQAQQGFKKKVPPPPPTATSVYGRASLRNAFEYSDNDDDESPSPPSLMNRSANTSFLPPSAGKHASSSDFTFNMTSRNGQTSTPVDRHLSSATMLGVSRYGADGLMTPHSRFEAAMPPPKSPFHTIVNGLNRFRLDTYEKMSRKVFGRLEGKQLQPKRQVFGEREREQLATSRFVFEKAPSPSPPRMQAGGGASLRGRLDSRSVHAGEGWASRFLLAAFFVLVGAIVLGYLLTAHRPAVKAAYHVVGGAAVDTVNFIYTKLILPLLAVLTIGLLVAGGYLYRQRALQKAENQQKEIYNMVYKICEVLRKHAQLNSRDPYLAIPHVRDRLILPTERQALSKVWDGAVEYVNEMESRIGTETRVKAGRDCAVWRWLPPTSDEDADPFVDVASDGWHGNACEQDPMTERASLQPFSECLKIRGMFDGDIETGADWPEYVQDALLEKLGAHLHAMHIAVETKSKEGCVYMKMETKEHAGQAYKALHGSWFNGRLVSVKYLRPERYLERFPATHKSSHPLTIRKPRHTLH